MSASPHELKQAFADAVHNLSEEPTPENVVRYLQASRELDRAAEPDAAERDALAA